MADKYLRQRSFESHHDALSPAEYAEELFKKLRRDFSASLQQEREEQTKNIRQLYNDLRDRIDALEHEVTTLKELIDEQRETIQLLWDAPANPGGQEMIRQAKESAAAYFIGARISATEKIRVWE